MFYIAPGSVDGYVRVPGSKSHMQRAILVASMAVGVTCIQKQGYSADDKACIEVIKTLGAKVEQIGDVLSIFGNDSEYRTILNCGESGFCARASAAISALKDRSIKITGCGSLVGRPMGMVCESLVQLGAYCDVDHGSIPITVCGPIVGGKLIVSGAISSQFISGLLMALPKASRDSELLVTGLRSKSYVRMTLDTIASFGVQIESNNDLSRFNIRGNQIYQATNIVIEGDWSSAAFMLVAGAIAGKVTIVGLKDDSIQADRAILNILEAAGAKFCWNSQGLTICKSDLKAFEFDATDCPDLFPPLVALACCAEGTSSISGVTRLIYKESNRGVVLNNVFSELGANIKICDNTMKIIGGPLVGGSISSNNDHRIAMACAVAGLITNCGVCITDEHCVAKSYPDFFNVLQSIRDPL